MICRRLNAFFFYFYMLNQLFTCKLYKELFLTTQQGKLQLYNIGKFLRERYDHFLGKIYDPDEYYAQSTDVDRTITSVQVLNAALWPPEPQQKWGPINWQPIPVHIEPLSTDTVSKTKQKEQHRWRGVLISSFKTAAFGAKTLSTISHGAGEGDKFTKDPTGNSKASTAFRGINRNYWTGSEQF